MGKGFRSLLLAALAALAACGGDSVPPVEFSVEPGTAFAVRGETLAFAAVPTPAGAVAWGVAEGDRGSISADGVLTVAPTAPLRSTVTVTAESGGVRSSATVTVVAVPSAVSVEASETLLAPGDSAAFRATVSPGGSLPDVVWSIAEPRPGVSISGIGFLTVAPTAALGSLTVRAASLSHPDVYGEVNLAVVTLEEASAPRGVVVPGPAMSISSGESVRLEARVVPERAPQDVTWTMEDDPEGVILHGDGLLETTDIGGAPTDVRSFVVRVEVASRPDLCAEMTINLV